jgi:trimeric autotransporter adhesin
MKKKVIPASAGLGGALSTLCRAPFAAMAPTFMSGASCRAGRSFARAFIATSAQRLCLLGLAVATSLLLPVAHAQPPPAGIPQVAADAHAAAHPSRAFWKDLSDAPAARSARGAEPAIRPKRFRSLTVDAASLGGALAAAPREFTETARQSPVVITLPAPDGSFQRFAIVESPVMEDGLAAKHPQIRTYSGRGIDDPSASLRMSMTQLGLQVSVRSKAGGWYIDPYYRNDISRYVSYWRRDAGQNPRGRFNFSPPLTPQAQIDLQRGRYRAGEPVLVEGSGFLPGAPVTIEVREAGDAIVRQSLVAIAESDGTLYYSFTADPYSGSGSFVVTVSDGQSTSSTTYEVVAQLEPLETTVGSQLRTYRLALLTDPSYAAYFGPENVTAAKVQLINRVNQVYETDSAIRMVLIAENDRLNLNTDDEMTGANGPCGATACYNTAQASLCFSTTLTRTRQVIGLLVGASNFDVGHIGLGRSGGGIASLGVVGGSLKAQGCTGIDPPTGDVWAIDYVAHELGHQYGSNHTFNGTQGNCSGGNRSGANSVEPGSGSSVMAYAGICGADNLQLNTDPYWSMRSLDVITAYVSGAEIELSEVQLAALTGFNTNGQQFQLRYDGSTSSPVVRGTNYTATGIKAVIETIAGWPAGGTVTINMVTDGGFQITFGGTLANTNVPMLELVNCSVGCSGFVGEISAGGPTNRRGQVVNTGNMAPVVTAPAAYTIPVRTPFALTGSAIDVDGDVVTYMWEQTDRGGTTGTALINDNKVNGPLFRQFSKRAVFNAQEYEPPGQNHPDTDPTRVFPDWEQILSNNTNAETGGCPNVVSPPSVDNIECYSEFLPTSAYVGFAGVNADPPRLNMRLTARDGRGGVGSASAVLTLAPAAGPFLVTAPNSAMTLDGGKSTTVTWDVANTNVAPVNAANVSILLSTDGGATWPYVLASSVPNNGSRNVMLPDVETTQARIKVEAVENVFFDVSNADFEIRSTTKLVPVDILPNSCPNPLSVGMSGMLPVAILGTGDIDVTEIDPETVMLEGVAASDWSLMDVATPYEPYVGKPFDQYACSTFGPDEFVDLVLYFDRVAVGAALGPVSDGDVLILQLTGEYTNGTLIVGEDVIRIIDKKKKKK